ncbi:MAG: ATPase protein [Mycobacterium sp.]|nr:ATPase protein [Mycobacterium sp.]
MKVSRLRRRWTLRGRLLAGLLALLAVLCAVIGVVSVTVLHNQVLNQVDRQLTAAGQRADNGGPNGPFGNRPRPQDAGAGALVNIAGQPAGTLGAVIVSGTVTSAQTLNDQIDQSSRTTSVPESDWTTLSKVPADGKPHTIDLNDLGNYRVLATDDPSAANTVRLIGIPLKDANSTVTNLALVISIVSLIGLAGAGIAGSVIVRLALRPLRRVTETATRVSKLPLDRGEVALQERVPEADTDTRTEVGQVGAALNGMLGHVATALSARQASEMRVRQFVADASHELRTPLAAIRGYAELTRRTGDDLPGDITYAMDRVESEATRMTGLVEDLLLLARLDTGRPIDMEPVDLTALVIDAVSDAHAAGPAHPVRLALPDEPVEIIGDPARLHQVLTNLLTNARTHTAPGTRIEVTLRQPRPDSAVVEIADEGPGIAPDLLPFIFERFARADTSRSRKAGSTGLGLAIVSAVVSAHGGSVDVQTRPGRTTFAVTLPTSAGVPAKTKAAAPGVH